MTKLPTRAAAKPVLLLEARPDSIMLQETSLWLQNFISDRTREAYKKAVQDFAGIAELETADDLFDVDASTVLARREHLLANQCPIARSPIVCRRSHRCSNTCVTSKWCRPTRCKASNDRRPPQQGVTPAIANKMVCKILDDTAEAMATAKTPNAAMLAARDSAIVHVLFYLGPRVSEVCAMNVGDIVADGEYTVVKLTVKGGQAHRVPAPPEALAAVKLYLSMAGHTKGAMFRRVKGGDGLRKQPNGQKLTNSPIIYSGRYESIQYPESRL